MIQKLLFTLTTLTALVFGIFYYQTYINRLEIIPSSGLSKLLQNATNTIESPKYEEVPKHGYQKGPIINVRNENYFVSGNDRELLCKQIDSGDRQLKKDMVEVGHIEFNLGYKYMPISTEKGFTIGDFTVTTNSVITVPQWSSSAGASDDLKKDWREFKNSVAKHEGTHQSILVEHATSFVATLNNFGYFTTIDLLDTQVVSAYDSMYKRMEKDQDEFDENSKERLSDFCNND